jgi:hypothetical protein
MSISILETIPEVPLDVDVPSGDHVFVVVFQDAILFAVCDVFTESLVVVKLPPAYILLFTGL